jgi:uncharacterized repeat protein (TIGR04138 family)
MNETAQKTLEQVVAECDRYPLEAFQFVQAGLNHTVEHVHGPNARQKHEDAHVSGQQLSAGLRDYAILRYGLLARAVLAHWHINRTADFGRIVWAMVESKLMQKTERDALDDFDEVYDFRTAFDAPERPAQPTAPVFKL